MKVRLWGTRGNIASPGAHTIELGGNTSCVEVKLCEERSVILDCGTGLIAHASAFMSRAPGASGVKAKDHHIVFSHFHWDHVLGFPFFHPLHVPGTHVHLYSAFPAAEMEEHIRALFDGTYSPLRDLDNVAAKVTFHEITEQGAAIASAFVTTCPVDHTETCYAIRVGHESRSITYITDHETRNCAANDAVVSFAVGSDLLIHDAQYTSAEYEKRVGRGHSSIDAAIDNGVAMGVPHVLLSHHDPEHSDDFRRLYLARHLQRRRFARNPPRIELAREGQTVEL